MKLNNSFPLFKSLVPMFSFLFFTSCMMVHPGHLSSMHQAPHSSVHSSALVDPVCGNSLELTQNTLSVQHLNNTYYFDSQECLSKFQNAPENFSKQHHGVRSQNGILWGLGVVAMLGMMALMLF
jgi:YHS domain-containing protein